jgi:hypothetical protein
MMCYKTDNLGGGIAELVACPPTDPKVRPRVQITAVSNVKVSKLDHIVTVQHVAINNHGINPASSNYFAQPKINQLSVFVLL